MGAGWHYQAEKHAWPVCEGGGSCTLGAGPLSGRSLHSPGHQEPPGCSPRLGWAAGVLWGPGPHAAFKHLTHRSKRRKLRFVETKACRQALPTWGTLVRCDVGLVARPVSQLPRLTCAGGPGSDMLLRLSLTHFGSTWMWLTSLWVLDFVRVVTSLSGLQYLN